MVAVFTNIALLALLPTKHNHQHLRQRLSSATATNTKIAATSSFSSFLENSNINGGSLDSPERYAEALNMTVEEVRRKKAIHSQASEMLLQRINCRSGSSLWPPLTGNEKHALICENRLKYGRDPFVCNECWSYAPVCLCHLAGTRRPLPDGVDKVLVWTHHREWGLTSNTGCLLALTLQNTTMLMKGWPGHDQILEDSLSHDDCLAVVLWPSNSNNDGSTQQQQNQIITLDQVRTEMKHRRLILIAVDGTWRNARKMVSKLPKNLPRLDLPMDAVFPNDNGESNSGTTVAVEKSILAPLRSKGPVKGDANDRQVCTAEAVAGALMQLGLSRIDGDHILDVTQTKVDLIRRYRGISTNQITQKEQKKRLQDN